VRVSLPEELLAYSVRGSASVPLFLTEHDEPWLRQVIERVRAASDRRRGEALRDLRVPLGGSVDSTRQRAAVHVLTRLCRARAGTTHSPRLVRVALFRRASARAPGEPRAAIVAAVAAQLDATPEQVEEALFADLPEEQLLGELPSDLTPRELALRTNLAIVQGIVARSARLEVELEGNARTVVRQAKLGGLICNVSAQAGPWRLDISGPFALFQRTLLYGRALAALVPLLCWCPRFRLRAECVLRGERLRFELSPDDPIFPADEPRAFDSLLEARLGRDLARLTLDWRLVREPGPLRAGAHLAFPDFSLQHRSGGRRWLVEIVGFWTPGYLERKLALYRAARAPDLILCIDDRRRCEPGEIPAGARVVWFHRRIDPAVILAIVEGRHGSA
jgi:uncharacterized protein